MCMLQVDIFKWLIKARRDMGTVAKDLQNVQKALTSMEAKIDQKKSERHSILKQSKVTL